MSTQREGSRLEVDDDTHCKTCGIPLPWMASIVYGYEQCPECILKDKEEELLAHFGSLKASEVMRQDEYETAAEWYEDDQ